MNAIKTTQLCKTYGAQRVLYDVDIEVKSGKLIGFLGPNGAGKTTSIRILLGLISASSGTAQIFGNNCARSGKVIRAQTGYLPGDVHFYPGMTGRKTLDFFARARRRNCGDEIERLGDAFDLELNKVVRKYSTGMRQKLGLIQALMHKPELLILDEPTSALDPLVRNVVFEELRKVVEEGRTVLFSSHSLNEVEKLCDEVIILRKGRIVEHQTIDLLRERALRNVEIVFASAVPQEMPAGFRKANPAITQHRTEEAKEVAARTLAGSWTGDVAALIKWLEPLQVEDLIVERPDLNDLFINYYASKEMAPMAEA